MSPSVKSSSSKPRDSSRSQNIPRGETEKPDPTHEVSTVASKPKDLRRKLGTDGETRAAQFLRRRGYLILERNIRCGGVEVDLIVRRGSWIVFVEVKTRRSTRYGPPQLAVDSRKQKRLVRAAHAWLTARSTQNLKVRFDVVACLVSRSGGRDHWQINHLKAAFDAEGQPGTAHLGE